jgi:hypothetical protein
VRLLLLLVVVVVGELLLVATKADMGSSLQLNA